MYLNFLINVTELHISFCFFPSSLITFFLKFIHVAMATADLLSLDCCSLLCYVHPPRLPVQCADDHPGGLQLAGTATNAAVGSSADAPWGAM